MIAPAGYADFLATKVPADPMTGLDRAPDLNDALFPWQAEIVRWALRRGRAATFADTGLGKTLMQLEWARHVAAFAGGPILVLTPLAVARQTIREGAKFGVPVTHCRSQEDVQPGVNVTNYERLHLFDPAAFAGVVLDESSILKSYMGKTKRAIIDAFQDTRFRLACTATPAPNDHMELGNHAEFLGILESTEMLSRWFINDTMNAGTYRLKRHAEDDFWRWVASWAVCVALPSDLRDAEGVPYSDEGFRLPPLGLHEHFVGVDHSLADDGELFRSSTLSATTLHKEMRLTAPDRARKVADLVASEPGEPWIVWCNTNYEADEVTKLIPDAIEVRGSDSPEAKERKLAEFSDGTARVIVTKPSIAGFGLNWQHCARMAFVGLSYSYEQLYQALRRSYRFGQTREVQAHLVLAETEVGVLSAIRTKQEEHRKMQRAMVDAMKDTDLGGNGLDIRSRVGDGIVDTAKGDGWTLHLGDCVDVVSTLEEDSVGFSVFSPPFSNLYIYTDSLRDMGNTQDDAEFMEHFGYLIPELLRVTKPGRLCAVHCKDLPMYQGKDGAAGLRDFPGEIVRAFSAHGWTFHSRVTIWKCPVTEMQRTKNHGLLYKELCKDSSGSRQGMADYLLVFRKWNESGDFPDPVTNGGERFDHYLGMNPPDPTEIAVQCNVPVPGRSKSGKWPKANPFQRGTKAHRLWSIMVWQKYASPVWMDIDQTDVLNYQLGKDGKDEKHICPLQLQVIGRAVHLWSNPGDLTLSPFTGIGSEGYQSLLMGRQFVGAELKESYWRHAQANLTAATERELDLFEAMAASA